MIKDIKKIPNNNYDEQMKNFLKEYDTYLENDERTTQDKVSKWIDYACEELIAATHNINIFLEHDGTVIICKETMKEMDNSFDAHCIKKHLEQCRKDMNEAINHLLHMYNIVPQKHKYISERKTQE